MESEAHKRFTEMRNGLNSHFDELKKNIKPKGIFDLKTRGILGRLTTLQREMEKELYDVFEKGGDIGSLISKYQKEENEILRDYGFQNKLFSAFGVED